MPSHRRFPPPWTVEELDACFVVIDSAEQKLAYVYFEEEAGRRSAGKLLGDVRGNASDIWNFRPQCHEKELRRALQPPPES